jgi:hypothetical protein
MADIFKTEEGKNAMNAAGDRRRDEWRPRRVLKPRPAGGQVMALLNDRTAAVAGS